MSRLLNKKHILLILSILIISVEVQGARWSRLYQPCVSNKVRHAITMAKNHPIISLLLLLGGRLFVYNKIAKRSKQDIWKAVNKGDSAVVHNCLRGGFDVHGKNENGDELIHQAVMNNRPDIIKILFNYDSSIDKSRDVFGKIPLQLAAEFGKQEAAKFLLSKVNLYEYGLSPLLNLAVINGHKEVAGYFIDRGANVNLLNQREENIFIVARKIDKENRGMGMEEFLNRKVAERL